MNSPPTKKQIRAWLVALRKAVRALGPALAANDWRELEAGALDVRGFAGKVAELAAKKRQNTAGS